MLFAFRCIRIYYVNIYVEYYFHFPRQNMFKFSVVFHLVHAPTHISICNTHTHLHSLQSVFGILFMYTQTTFSTQINRYFTVCDIQTHRICWFTRLLVLFRVDLCYLLFKDFKRNMMDMDVRWIWINVI